MLSVFIHNWLLRPEQKRKKSIILNYSTSKQLPTVLMGDKIAHQSLKFECFFKFIYQFSEKSGHL